MAGTITAGGLSIGVDPRPVVSGDARHERRAAPVGPPPAGDAVSPPGGSVAGESAELARARAQLRERIDASTRAVDGLEHDLRRELTALDVLAAHLEAHAAFLART
jgi:hypothetical protein